MIRKSGNRFSEGSCSIRKSSSGLSPFPGGSRLPRSASAGDVPAMEGQSDSPAQHRPNWPEICRTRRGPDDHNQRVNEQVDRHMKILKPRLARRRLIAASRLSFCSVILAARATVHNTPAHSLVAAGNSTIPSISPLAGGEQFDLSKSSWGSLSLAKVETKATSGKRTRSSRARESPTPIPARTVASIARATTRQQGRTRAPRAQPWQSSRTSTSREQGTPSRDRRHLANGACPARTMPSEG